MSRVNSAALVLSAGFLACAAPPPTIDRADVERVISTLAADDMEGRATFSEGIDRAAAFIQQEFADIGLEPLNGLESFEQSFVVSSASVTNSRVELNGRRVPGDRFLSRLSNPSVDWTTGDVEVVAVRADEDLAGAFTSRRNASSDALVLVDEAHRELFGRIKRFATGPVRTLGAGGRANTVFVLTSARRARSYRVRASSDISELRAANVVGQIPGRRTDEIVLFSAHYDHIGIRPAVDGDSIANGANDDASGTTAVIELARYFKTQGQPERTLIFAAFTGEEMGGYGSRYFSRQLDPDQVVAMFNIEMIGKPAVEGPNTAWLTGFERSSFGEILQEAAEGTLYEFYPDPYPDQNLFYRSDNATLARLGVPAHSISTTPIDVDTDYHRVSDEVETLDLDHMTNTIAAIAQGAATIVSGQATPTRVDTTRVN